MIEITNLNKTYDKKTRNSNHVLKDVSLTLPDTGFVCIVGTSGCGKTSLLNAVGGLDSFDSGKISIKDTVVTKPGTRAYERERNNSFGYIFQNYYLLSDHSVAYNVYLGLHSLKLSHKERVVRVKEALEAVNMSRYSRRIVGELSGGQQQRVAIARALARRPKVIFADEPTGNLDEENTLNICRLLRGISRTSLVVMVTHEEHIARFFADRIINLGEGRIVSDTTSWDRKNLTFDSTKILYAGDYHAERADSQELHIRVLTQEDAAPAELTIAVLKDKIIIKTDDSRTISCSKLNEAPVLKEGASPAITLKDMDGALTYHTADTPAKAGGGFPFGMMFEEARRLIRQKGIQRGGVRFFLAAITILTIWMVGDYLTVSSVDPRDFIVSDSHLLHLSIERGEEGDPYERHVSAVLLKELGEKLQASGMEFDVLPYVTATNASFTLDMIPQMSAISMRLQNFSYAPVTYLDEDSLIYGRMPENCREIVIDRWVLETAVAKDGIVQNTIQNIQQLLGKQLDFSKKSYAPVVVGICDCGDPTVYISKSALVSIGDRGTPIMTYSEFLETCPGIYDGEALKEGECIVVTNNAGIGYKSKIGSDFNTNSGIRYKIIAAVEADTYASLIVADSAVEELLYAMSSRNYCFYAPDKQAMKDKLIEILETDYQNSVLYKLQDINGDAQRAYKRAASLKADARTIVTFTIIALSMVMLYLLQRTFVQQRIGMMAVYRLLGLPGRKLTGIFFMESLMLSLKSIVPAAAATWSVVAVLNLLTDLKFSMILPWQAAALVGFTVMLYYILVSLLPACRILRLSPARLASKYDM